jgi:DNA primase
VRAADQLVVAGLDTGMVILPENEDPDSFIRKEGADALRGLIRTAPDYFSYLRGEADKGSRSVSKKRQVIEHLMGTVSRVEDRVRQEILLQELSGLFDITVETLRSSLKTRKKGRKPSKRETAPAIRKIDKIQKGIFRIGLKNGDLARLIVRNLIEEDLDGEIFRKYFREFKVAVEQGEDPSDPQFTGSMTDPELAGLASEIALMDIPPGPPRDLLVDTLGWLKRTALKSEMRAMKERIEELQGEAAGDASGEEIAIAEAYRKIAKELRKLEIKEDSQFDSSQ